MAVSAVLGNEDLLHLILQHAGLSPAAFVAVSRVSKAWHSTCMRDSNLMLSAALRATVLTKRVLMGLLALSSREADSLPRYTRLRRGGGFMYVYPSVVAVSAWADVVGGIEEWHARLYARKLYQQSIEAEYGLGWRKLQWQPTKLYALCC
jgi:hypothetical protein